MAFLESAICVAAVTDAHDEDDELVVVDGKEDVVMTLAYPIDRWRSIRQLHDS